MKKSWPAFLAVTLVVSGCSLQKIAIRSTTGILYRGIDAIYQEPDLKIAEQAIASDLKLLEGLYLSDPQNNDLLLMLTQGYASYSLGFVEDEDKERARLFYLRARDYGFKLLRKTDTFEDSIPQKEKNFMQRLALVKKDQVPAIFWTAFAWGGWINLSKDNPRAIFDLRKVKAMMTRVLELDEDFFFGAAHLFLGSVQGALPRMLGGNPEKAKYHFDRCIQISGGKFLLANVYLAQYYALPTLDESLFTHYLEEVLSAPGDVLPGYELLTAIAKNKARRLLNRKTELF